MLFRLAFGITYTAGMILSVYCIFKGVDWSERGRCGFGIWFVAASVFPLMMLVFLGE